jgi:hypothetical protein
MQHPPEVQLSKLRINRSRRSSIHGVVRGSRSVGGLRASERRRSDDGGACKIGLRSGYEAGCAREPTEIHG